MIREKNLSTLTPSDNTYCLKSNFFVASLRAWSASSRCDFGSKQFSHVFSSFLRTVARDRTMMGWMHTTKIVVELHLAFLILFAVSKVINSDDNADPSSRRSQNIWIHCCNSGKWNGVAACIRPTQARIFQSKQNGYREMSAGRWLWTDHYLFIYFTRTCNWFNDIATNIYNSNLKCTHFVFESIFVWWSFTPVVVAK